MIVVDTIFVQQGGYEICLSRTIRSSRSSRRSAHFIGNIGIAPPPRDPGFHPEPTSCPPLCRPKFQAPSSKLQVPSSKFQVPRQLPRCSAVTGVPASVVSLTGTVPYGWRAGPGDDLSSSPGGQRREWPNERATRNPEPGTRNGAS